MSDITPIAVTESIKKIYESLNWIQGLSADALSSSTSSVKLELDIQEESPFYSNFQHFELVMENMISNSIKYQNIARETRFVRIEGKVDQHFLALRVSDNGVGISPEYHEKIFEMYFRIPSKIYGTGMGLFIVKEIVERLDGSVRVESELGRGTVFLIKIPNHFERA